MKTSFFNFLQNFIFKVFVTDNVLSFIGAPELMEFQNKINQLYFEQDQETALNSVREKNAYHGDLHNRTQRLLCWSRPIQ